MSRLQSVHYDSLCSSSNVPFEGLCTGFIEGLHTGFNYPEGALIGPLKWSPVGITSDKYKLGLLKVGWEASPAVAVLGDGNGCKCTCAFSPCSERAVRFYLLGGQDC